MEMRLWKVCPALPNIHTYIHTHIHTYIDTYIHTYINTYIPTYIHTYLQFPRAGLLCGHPAFSLSDVS